MLLALVLAFTDSATCPGLPLTAGASWTYRADVTWAVGSGSLGRRSVAWTTTVLSVRTTDSAVAATIRGWPGDLASWEPGREPSVSVLYCTGGRVYHVRPRIGTAAALVEDLLSGTQRPVADDLILELPLHTGALFGRDPAARTDNLYAWLVEGAQPVPPSVRRLHPGIGDSLYSVAYRTNPDHTIVGFVPGLGVVHYVYEHHGTPAASDAWLVGYPAQ